jgi:hypothetical protein
MRAVVLAMMAVGGLAACVPTYQAGYPPPLPAEAPVPQVTAAPLPPREAAANFIRVVRQVEPMTE